MDKSSLNTAILGSSEKNSPVYTRISCPSEKCSFTVILGFTLMVPCPSEKSSFFKY